MWLPITLYYETKLLAIMKTASWWDIQEGVISLLHLSDHKSCLLLQDCCLRKFLSLSPKVPYQEILGVQHLILYEKVCFPVTLRQMLVTCVASRHFNSTALFFLTLDEPETRDAWWSEVRMEIRSHARALGCHAVIGYYEVTSIWWEILSN